MALDSLLTTTRLKSLADYGYERGVAYFQSGNVLACESIGDGIEGIVAGPEALPYKVRVFAHGRELAWQCTCPVEGDMCKHAVALSLHYLSGTPSLVSQPSAPEARIDAVFETAAQLGNFAREKHVEHELATSALVLLPTLFEVYRNETGLHYMLARLTLRETGSMEAVTRYVGVRQLHRVAAVATATWMARAAEDVVAGVAEEKKRAKAPVSTDGTVRALWAKLRELRETIRADAWPRSRVGRAHGRLGFDGKSVRVLWEERAIGETKLSSFGVVSTQLSLVPTKIACSCGKVACTHGLAVIDEMFDFLEDPQRVEEAERVAEELLRPPWKRALAAIADLDAEDALKPTQVEVWWEIDEMYGAPTLSPVVKKPLKRGGMSAGTRIAPQKLLADHAAAMAEQDIKIAEHLASWIAVHRASTYASRAFSALVGHPRVRLVDGEQIVSVKRFPLGFTALPVGNEIRIEPAVDGARFSPRLLAPLMKTFADGEPLFVVEPEHERVILIDISDEARALFSVLEKHGDLFPPESHDQLLAKLGSLERKMPVSVPHSLKGARWAEELTMVARLRITPAPASTLELEAFVRPAPGAPIFAPSDGPRDVLVVRDGTRGYVRREPLTELERVRGLLARLPQLDDAIEGPPLVFSISDPDVAISLVQRLQTPPPGIEAEWIDRKQSVVASISPAQLQLRIERKRDWFGIDGHVVVEAGRLELAAMLIAVREQRRFVRLDENRWVELTEKLRERLVAISDQTYTTRNELELSPGAVPAIRDALAAGIEVKQPPAWEEITARLASSAKLRPKPPASLAMTLRPYQIDGHAWLTRVAAWGAGACLADDMGLGKTIQAIAVLLDRAKRGPALVLAPTSVTLNWVEELKRFAPTLKPIIYSEVPDRAAALAKLGPKDVLIVSYGLLARDIEMLAGVALDTLVVDEAQALKNPSTQRAKAARRLQAAFRIALSGTPFENHLGELWSLFSIVFPGLLGSWDQFRERYALPIERDKNPEARAALSRVIRPFLLRRTKGDVARELPARTEIEVPIALSTAETQMYEDVRLLAVAELSKQAKKTPDDRQRFQVLAALTKLRLLASHPKLHDAESPVASSKMQRLLELVDELRSAGPRALIFSQFTSHLELVQDELTHAGVAWLYLDGGTPLRERARLIEAFQGGEGDVFLISLKAGGTGINLTAADYVIHLDPWWNPAVEDQATDRAHRIGQTRPVTVYRLIARGTVEERILQLHASKRALVADVLDGSDVAGKLTTKDLLALIAGPG